MNRSKLYAIINMGKNQLNMDEDSYRTMIKRLSGHESLKSCSFDQLNLIIDELKQKGFKLQSTSKKPKAPSPILSKVKSLWYELYECGAIANNDDASLSSFCKRHTNLDSWRWMDDAEAIKIIEILKQWKKRFEK